MLETSSDQFIGSERRQPPAILMEETIVMVEHLQVMTASDRQILLDTVTRQILENPLRLRPLLHNLGVVNIVRNDLNPDDAREAIIGNTEDTLKRRINLDVWTPDRIASLAMARVTGSDNRQSQDIEKIEAALFSSPRSVNHAIDLLYNTAWAMVATPNLAVQRELFSVLSFRKNWLTADSPAAIYFTAGLFATDDEHLARLHSIITSLDYIGILTDRPKSNILRLVVAGGFLPPSQARLLNELISNSRAMLGPKAEPLFEVYAEQGYLDQELPGSGGSFLEAAERRDKYELTHNINDWPHNVLRDPNEPLRKLVLDKFGDPAFRAKWENRVVDLQKEGYELQTQHPIQLNEDLSLVVMARRIHSVEQRKWVLDEVRDTLLTGQSNNPVTRLYVPMDRVLSEARLKRGLFDFFDAGKNIVFAVFPTHTEEALGRLPSIIEYHRPVISTEQFEEISRKTQEARRHIQTLYTRSLGERGYRISFDPNTRKRGYQNATFRFDRQTGETHVRLTLDKQTYEIVLDRGYKIIPGGDVKRFASLQDQIWLELLILTNLKKVLCTEEGELKNALTDGKRQIEVLRKQTIYRGEGMRWFRHPYKWVAGKPVFSHWSSKADQLFRQAGFPDMTEAEKQYGLRVANQLRAEEGRGGTAETGWWTYVQPSRKGDEITEPIRITFKDNEDLYSVLPSSIIISPEELQRLYAAALGEVYEVAV